MIDGSCVFFVQRAREIDRVWVGLLGSIASALQGNFGERGRVVMKRGCVRVSPSGTDVMGIVACSEEPVARCVSVADTSLSLSLSLLRF
jgi:hypothetical protein